jgi:hypothetical protein
MPLEMGTRMSRRRLLLAMAGLAGAAVAGRVLGADGALAGGAPAAVGVTEHERLLPGPSGERDEASLMCPGVSLYEATLHGDETLVLPAVDRWRELTGFYPFILPLWSPFDLDLPAPRGNIFPADWLLQGLRDRGIEPAIFAHSADEPRWETHGYEAILRGDRDEALEEWGLAAARYGHPLIFRWDQEMNGKFPWSDRPAREYVAVFRHVSERIRRVAGAGNVEFHFCPGLRRERPGMDIIESYYPGDEWCQHVGFDGYSRTAEWMPLAEQWGPLMDRLRSISRRPIVVGEFGRRIDLDDRDGWLRSLRDVQGVSAVFYFDMNLTHFEAPAHHWLMDRPMREVYANLPRCERSIAQREPSPTAEASTIPAPSNAPAGPSPSPGASVRPNTSANASPSARPSPGASPGPSG